MSSIIPPLGERPARIPPSAIVEMFDLAASLQNPLRLDRGEPDFITPQVIIEGMAQAARQGMTKLTSSRGIPALREAIAAKLQQENGVVADAEREILVTAGAASALALAFLALLNPGDEVLIPEPAWPNYRRQTLMAGGVPVGVDLEPGNGFLPTLERLKERRSPRTRVLVLNSPHNPTGSVLPPDLLRSILEWAVGEGLYVLVDEVYERLVWEGGPFVSASRFAEYRSQVVSIFSFSKTYAMTGWRIGYAVGSERVIRAMTTVTETLYAAVPSVVQAGALAAFGAEEEARAMVAAYARRRRQVLSALEGNLGLAVSPARGAFYVFLDVRRFGSDRSLALDLAREQGVVLVPGSGFGAAGEGFLRLCYANSEPVLSEAMVRLGRFLERRS